MSILCIGNLNYFLGYEVKMEILVYGNMTRTSECWISLENKFFFFVSGYFTNPRWVKCNYSNFESNTNFVLILCHTI